MQINKCAVDLRYLTFWPFLHKHKLKLKHKRLKNSIWNIPVFFICMPMSFSYHVFLQEHGLCTDRGTVLVQHLSRYFQQPSLHPMWAQLLPGMHQTLLGYEN